MVLWLNGLLLNRLLLIVELFKIGNIYLFYA